MCAFRQSNPFRFPNVGYEANFYLQKLTCGIKPHVNLSFYQLIYVFTLYLIWKQMFFVTKAGLRSLPEIRYMYLIWPIWTRFSTREVVNFHKRIHIFSVITGICFISFQRSLYCMKTNERTFMISKISRAKGSSAQPCSRELYRCAELYNRRGAHERARDTCVQRYARGRSLSVSE